MVNAVATIGLGFYGSIQKRNLTTYGCVGEEMSIREGFLEQMDVILTSDSRLKREENGQKYWSKNHWVIRMHVCFWKEQIETVGLKVKTEYSSSS